MDLGVEADVMATGLLGLGTFVLMGGCDRCGCCGRGNCSGPCVVQICGENGLKGEESEEYLWHIESLSSITFRRRPKYG
jgi:hypothetical protein